VGLFDPGLPAVWDASYVRVAEPHRFSASDLAAISDDLMGPRGFKHREVFTYSEDEGGRLADEFEQLGWRIEIDLIMKLDRLGARGASARIVKDHDVDAIQLAVLEGYDDVTPEAARGTRQISRRIEALEWLDHVWFGAPDSGPVTSSCRLFSHGGVGQIEDVATLPSARNQGLASSVVTAAAQASIDAGNELTFLVADAGDWPQKLYRKLGFVDLARFYVFRRID
jgi:ribosomal protein S18 acetylase RimI-like enzyme